MSNLLAIASTLPQGDSITTLALCVLAAPLCIFFFLIFFGRAIHKYRGIIATVVMFICFVTSIFIFKETWNVSIHKFSTVWFSFNENLNILLGVKLDNLTALMLLIVTFVSFLVHLFSIEYLRGDRHFEKYFAYLGLFTFSMLGIILSSSLLSIFIFWELVGLSSYLLIGFYFKKDAAIYANKKAFVVNRIGDAGFVLGLIMIYSIFGTFDLDTLYAAMETAVMKHVDNFEAVSGLIQYKETWLIVAGIGFFLGTVGKSAQFPLQVWLPNAMEGPTPVSALIHAATMVAAGVYFLARFYAFLHPDVLMIIAFVGAITAFMGAVAAVAQNDIKKVLAFSTISQLGYMVMGMGVGSYDASLFHLVTHAFFKAALFLAAGAVIHSMHDLEHKLQHDKSDVHFDPQDMRLMGGLRKRMPVTFVGYVVATMALAGLPFFSGFMSKDAILAGSLGWASLQTSSFYYIIPFLGFISALLTAFYMGRQLLMVFFGDFKLFEKKKIENAHHYEVMETPWLMRLPILALSTLSLGFAFSLNPFSGAGSWLLKGIKAPISYVDGILNPEVLNEAIHHAHGLTVMLSIGLVIVGFLLAYVFYGSAGFIALKASRVKYFGEGTFMNKLSQSNWFLDDIYGTAFVKSNELISLGTNVFDRYVIDGVVNFIGVVNVIIGFLVAWFDKYIVDGFVNVFSSFFSYLGKLYNSILTGKVQQYIGLALLVLIVIFMVFN